ncbi:SCP2 domain-containing protein [Seongchinamella sediminis]|uniref:Ubiquinone biosynthesis accessory factor UbiT n=1 Tax=Seongchinamella sediminis TaxID=2283635 RepID=A0A3L7DYI6_9GAMM|nr:SCP2 sterol-binding domain-containing protein [Seongchinamella sediminis]RLQ21061.1 SCP2 domain-containing protein [Seongchinamella sediminis]
MKTIPLRLASLPLVRHLPWRMPLQVLPRPLQLLAAEQLANQLLREQIESDDLDFLQGRIMRIRIKDLGYDWGITKLGPQLVFVQGSDCAEGCISGDSREFLLLASRREDADTLFFQRRLVIEGDTELGLQVKNLVDSIDLDEFPWMFNQAIGVGADFAEAFS